MSATIEFVPQLPSCPICKGRCISFRHLPADKGEPLRQVMDFECAASYRSEAKSDFKDPLKNYGPWSAWKCVYQCSRATEIALALLSKQSGT